MKGGRDICRNGRLLFRVGALSNIILNTCLCCSVCSSCKLECIVLCPIVTSCWYQSISTFNQALLQTRCFIIDTLCCLVHSTRPFPILSLAGHYKPHPNHSPLLSSSLLYCCTTVTTNKFTHSIVNHFSIVLKKTSVSRLFLNSN